MCQERYFLTQGLVPVLQHVVERAGWSAWGSRLPRIDLPSLVLVERGSWGGFPPLGVGIQPFGVLIATGVALGVWLSLKEARRFGLNRSKHLGFMLWLLLGGFAAAHVLNVLLYKPHLLQGDPLSFLKPWHGMSSFGGLIGGLLAGVLWSRVWRVRLLPHLENVAKFFPLSFAFGRAGCAVVHDHPGIKSDSWLAVPFADGTRYDLGLLEMLFLGLVAVLFLVLKKKPRRLGFFAGLFCVLYSPIRFLLDFLRVQVWASADARYLGLTPAQWLCPALLVLGLLLLARRETTFGRRPKLASNIT